MKKATLNYFFLALGVILLIVQTHFKFDGTLGLVLTILFVWLIGAAMFLGNNLFKVLKNILNQLL